MLTFPPIAYTPTMHAACDPAERCTVLYRTDGRRHTEWSQRVDRFERSCIRFGVEQEIARIESSPEPATPESPLVAAKRKADRARELEKARALLPDLDAAGALPGFDDDAQANELRELLSAVVVGIRQNGEVTAWPKGFEATAELVASAPRMFWLQVLGGIRQQQFDRAELGKS